MSLYQPQLCDFFVKNRAGRGFKAVCFILFILIQGKKKLLMNKATKFVKICRNFRYTYTTRLVNTKLSSYTVTNLTDSRSQHHWVRVGLTLNGL